MSDTMEVCDEEYGYNNSDYDDDSIQSYDSEDWGTSDPDEPSLITGGCKGTSIRILPAEQMVPEMKRRLKDTVDVLNIPQSAAAVLLREHKWSKDVLFEKFYNDPIKLEQKYGVFYRCNPVRVIQKANSVCEICYEEGQPMISMPCGHEFCKDCWRDFCDNAISEGPSCVRKSCPQAKCKEMMTEEEVEQAAPHLLHTFETYQLRSFIESNMLTRWCPGPGCERIAIASSTSALEQDAKVAKCDSCSTLFCLPCGEEPHAPCDCKEVALWNIKCKSESETANWILANTKPCPKCISRIEKNQGCNHMTCQKCKYEFCWICLGDWSNHGANTGGYYKCNKFDPDGGDKNDLSEAAKAKRELDRYLHYYKRYHAHSQAQSFAEKQLKETEARMILLQESSDSTRWSDVEFLKTANEQLIVCRRVLKYTYAFAYYLTDESRKMQRMSFEYQQELLERFTEILSELSEMPLAEMNRTDVVNQTRVVDVFMKNFLKFVDDGMETNPQAP